MQKKNWVKVFSTNKLYLAEIIRGVLEENDIESVLINNQSSAYVPLGYIDVYAPETEALKAFYLIEQNNL